MSTKERRLKKYLRTCLEILNSTVQIFVYQNTAVFIAAFCQPSLILSKLLEGVFASEKI